MEASAERVAESIKYVPSPDKQGFSWVAPELHISHYRTLFYGYDTLDYHLAAPEPSKIQPNEGFRLLITAHYGGNVRHYDFAKLDGQSSRALSHQKHVVERCQLFNSLISSCIYQDDVDLSLSRADLEHVRFKGLHLVLTSGMQTYEQIELPANYIQGFLKVFGEGR